MSGHHGPTSFQALRRALVLTLVFAVVEAVAGVMSGSLALVSDAGHMVTDSAGLALALLAAWVAARRPSLRYTYGLGRMEILAAVVNGLLMCGVVVWIVAEALSRLRTPRPVDGGVAMAVAGIGLLVNVVVARTLMAGERSLNVRAALLHVFGDLLGSVAALVSGAVILTTNWTPIDPILSLVICGLILVSAFRVLREGLHILLDGVPTHLATEAVGRAMAGVEGVRSVHDLHIWLVSSKRVALSAHVVLEDPDAWDEVLRRVQARLLEDFGIDHATLQPESGPRPIRIQLPGEGSEP